MDMKTHFLKRVGKALKIKKGRGRVKQFSIDAFIVFVSIGIFFTGGLIVWAATLDIPDFKNFDDQLMAESTKIYDRTGEILLYDVHGNVKRTVVPLEDISPYIKNATIALEDSRFYEHFGIRLDSIVRAALEDIRTGTLSEGGSTITQQVVKNTLLTNDKKFIRKAKEAIIALKMETVLSKDEILEIYLNVIPYGGSVYGVEEAAQRFFGKSASDLGLTEAAYLAALPQAPTYYSPYGNHTEALEWRKNHVLDRMVKLGYITKEERDKAVKAEVIFADPDQGGLKAPHFTLYVLGLLEEKYGREMIETAGLKVVTTLDYELYTKAQKIVHEAALRNARVNNANNMGMIGLDPNTGQILLMVGSRGYYDEKIDGKFNVTTSSNRQPGSAFKPIVYSTAFEKGYTTETIVFDLPTQFSTACGAFQTTGDCGYSPENYDLKFRGPVTFREALAQSINIPAVKALYLTGIENVLNNARSLGISNLKNDEYYGLSLALGAAQVSVLDMAGSYGVFANKGFLNDPVSILKITNSDGEVLYEFEKDSEQVLEEQAALKISDILSDNQARAPLYGLNSPLYFGGRDVAVKTGTTNNYRDAWTIGYTKNFVLAAWAGNNDNSPMAKKVSGYIITPTWRDVMDVALEEYPAIPFEEPEPVPNNIKPVLRGVWNPGGGTVVDDEKSEDMSFLEQFLNNINDDEELKNGANDVHSILYYVDTEDPRGAPPANPASDPQFRLWEPQVRAWAQGDRNHSGTDGENGVFQIEIDEPDRGEEFNENDEVNVTLNVNGVGKIERIEIFVNDKKITQSDKKPFEISFTPEDISSIKEENILRVVAINKNGVLASDTTTFEVY